MSPITWNNNKGKNWVFLYPEKMSYEGGSNYWDYYCENPDTERSQIALHPGTRTLGCISITEGTCWQKLENLLAEEDTDIISVDGLTNSGIPIPGFGTSIAFRCDNYGLGHSKVVKNVETIGSLYVTE